MIELTVIFRTILITVLTNSFMSIASNANQEHQYVPKGSWTPVR
jgi:hypothetical protein